MKKKSNIFNKIINMKSYVKILLSVLYFIISASFIFFKCNLYNIKNTINGKVDIYYDVVQSKEDDYKVYSIDFDKTSVKKLVVEYTSSKSFNLELEYLSDDNNSEYDFSDVDECSQYSTLNIYDVNDTLDLIKIKVPKSVSIDNVYIDNNYGFDCCLLSLFVIVYVVFVSLLYVYSKGFEKIYVLFAAMYISFGTFMIINMPPSAGSSWDDQIHFRSVVQTIQFDDYQKTEAEDIVIGLKSNFYYYDHDEEQKNYINNIDNLDKNVSIERNNKNVISYTSISYLPASILYNSLKTVGVSFSLRYNIVRIASVVMDALIIAYAIKIIKKYKLLLFSVGLIPEGLFIASNYNYDAFIFAFTILGFASFINMNNSDKVKTRDVLTFIVSITLATLTKVIYGPLLLLLFLIPNSKFKSVKNGKNVKKVLLIVTFLAMVAFIIPVIFSNVAISDGRGGSNVSLVLQAKYILKNPISAFMVLSSHVINHYFAYTISSQAMLFFAYRGSILPEVYTLLAFIFILSFLGSCEEKNDDKLLSKAFIEFLVFIIICATWLILYLSFNNVGSSTIGGVQPRYFMPLILYMIYPLITSKISCKFDKKNLLVVITALYTFIYIIVFLSKYCSFL